MWWLTIPVIIYSAGIFVLWIILRRHSVGDSPDNDSLRGSAGDAATHGGQGQVRLLPENRNGVTVDVATHGAEKQVNPQSENRTQVTVEVATPGRQETVSLLSEKRTGITSVIAAPGEEEYPSPLPKTDISVTVVVAVRNEERNVTTLLDSLVRQDYPRDLLEIIIVNDNSTDRTPVAVSEFMEAHRESSGISMRLIFNPLPGKKQAIRLGVSRSAGELILTTDADCTVGPGWVRAHVSEYQGGGKIPDMVLAPVVQRAGRGFWLRFGVYEFSALQSVTEATALAGHPVMCNAANMSFVKDVYHRHAGELCDDLPSGDDIFLLQAVRRGGGIVGLAGSSAAAVETAAAVSAAALLRQRGRWASKAWYYRDPATLTLAAATAACNAAVTAAAVGAAISLRNLPLLGALYAIRAVPDYLIIARNIKKSGEKIAPVPFVLSELIYPFWFVTVAAISLFPKSRRFATR